MKSVLKKLLPFLAMLLCAAGAFAATPEIAQDAGDPILRGLRAEMERSKTQLRLENMSTP
jgi:hypothetical protein